MTRTYLCAAVLLVPLLASAEPPGKPQYIADEISVTLREKPSNEAGSLGQLRSGMRVALLESLGADSFARIRTTDGREGWITARFLSDQPAAKDQLLQARKDVDEAHAQVQKLQRDLDSAQQQLAKARPALELAADNDRLRADIAQRERAVSELEHRYDAEKARRDTLMTGAALVGGGVILGLLLPLLGRGRKRSAW